MSWVQFILLALVLLFLGNKFRPIKGLINLNSEEVMELLKKSKAYIFIDVRELNEFNSGHIKGFTNIPLSQLKNRIAEIDRSKPIILTCRSGMRSFQAAKILISNKNVRHLKTGVSGWHCGLTKGTN